MNKKQQPSGRLKNHPGKIKLVITAAAMTMTLGFWSMFSNQAEQKALAQADPDPQVELTPDVQAGFLPLPTLIPPSGSSAIGNPTAAISTGDPLIKKFEQGMKILLGGNQPSKSQPRTITRTHSSR